MDIKTVTVRKKKKYQRLKLLREDEYYYEPTITIVGSFFMGRFAQLNWASHNWGYQTIKPFGLDFLDKKT